MDNSVDIMTTSLHNIKKTDIYEEKRTANKIKNDLTEYFDFITLLDRKRSPKSTRLIQDYIKKESNILQRICFIEKLDRKEKESRRLDIIEDRIEKDKTVVKASPINKKIKRVSLIRYIFSTRTPIQQFAIKTNIIKHNLIINPTLTKETHLNYKEYLKDVNNILINPILYIVENGWQYLDLKAYNTMVAFYNFLRQFLRAGNIIYKTEISTAYKGMEQFIIPYLQIISNKENLRRIQNTFYEVLFFIPKYKSTFKEMVSLITDLLERRSKAMSFCNIILGICIVNYRVYLRLEDILMHYTIPAINEKYYDLSRKIILNIREELNLSIEPYLNSERELFALKSIEENLYENNKINKTKYVYSIFIKVYSSNMALNSYEEKSRANRENFINELTEDMTITVSKFIRGFIKIYSDFLTGGETILKSKDGHVFKKKIITPLLFIKEVAELNGTNLDIIFFKKHNNYLNMKWETYDRYDAGTRFNLAKEERLYNLLIRVTETFYKIANKLALLLYRNHAAQKLTTKAKLDIHNSQNSTIKDIENTPRFIPYAAHSIINYPYLNNLTVIEALNEIYLFTINYCNLLKYRPLILRKNKKSKHFDIINHYFNIQTKIAHIKDQHSDLLNNNTTIGLCIGFLLGAIL